MNLLFVFGWIRALRDWTESLAMTPYGPAALFAFGGGQRQAQALVRAEIVSLLPERLDAEPDVGGI